MIILEGLDAPPLLTPPVILTIGNFDGLHRGHKRILRKVLSRAREQGGTSALVTFEPHPLKVLHPEGAPALILTLGQKRDIVSTLGLQVLVEVPFTPDFARMGAEEFVGLLADRLAPKEVYIGEDFRFGAGRRGDLRLLESLAPGLGFTAHGVPKVRVGGDDVSSTRIRALLTRGGMEEAAHLLGRPYVLEGEVHHGDARGATLGYPTANLVLANELVPALGVYAVAVDVGEPRFLPGVANLGRRPTFGEHAVTLEVHLLKGGRDLYGQSVRVFFFRFLRPEKKFPSAEALQEAIAADVASATAFLETQGLERRLFY